MVSDAAQESVDHGLVPEEVVPLFVGEIRCDDRGAAPIPFLHEFEEDVCLLGLDIEVAQLVHLCDAPHKWTNVAPPVM